MRLLGLVYLLAATIPGRADETLTRLRFAEPHMGTLFRITVYAPDEATAAKAAREAFARVRSLDGIMSDYKAESELMRLCAKAGRPPVPVSAELYHVLAKSQELARRTDGAFDVTVGPLVRLWRFARKTRKLPADEELKAARALVGYENLVLDAKGRTVRLKKEGMRLDLGSIGKGYAADEALRVLREHGLSRALVAAGGDVVAGDAPPGEKGWVVGIAPLTDPDADPKRKILLVNAAVSTSGDARQYVEIDGKRYSHIVDPKTGIGLTQPSSVTVVARRGIDSDALDTAACVLGAEKGLKLIEDTPGASGLFVRLAGEREVETRTESFVELK